MREAVGSAKMDKRLTIGFLDEDAYDEYHNMIAQGMCMSAQLHDINIIRFGHFLVNITTSDSYQEQILQEYIRQFRLDGLMFLGWARAAHNINFKRLFGDIPLVSIGSCIDGIPGVFFRGEDYIRKILLHLINIHKIRKIAYIAPFIPDRRNDAYLEIMKELNIFDPLLYVGEEELAGLSVGARGRRAVDILLDERKVKAGAIISLYNEETYEVINALNARGIKVPDDIAVTSYEDGEAGRFSTPAFTTVYFPWKELGYYGCEAMYSLITKGNIPMKTAVPGNVIFRDSCGCIPRSVAKIKTGRIGTSEVSFSDLSEKDLNAIAESLVENTAFSSREMQELLKKFRQAFFSGDSRRFLTEFEILLRKIEFYSDYSYFDHMVVMLRKALMPYFMPFAGSDIEKLARAENLFSQMQMILQNKLTNAWFREDVNYNAIKLTIKEVGQILITNFNVNKLMNSLETNLPRIGVNGCYIYLFNSSDSAKLFDDYRLEFEYCAGKRVKSARRQNKKDMRSFEEVLFREDRIHFILAHLLYAGDEFIGFILFDPTQMDLRVYRTLGLQIATALNGVNLFEKLDASYRRLMDQAHKKGMADTTGILHNIANIMNSVNVTAHSIESLLADSAVKDLRMANEMLEARLGELNGFICDDSKGKMLMHYYTSLGEVFSNFRIRLQTYIGRLLDRISLIEGIIAEQQSYTRVRSSLERLDLIPVIEDVIKMSQSSIGMHGIRIDRIYDSTVTALAQRTKLFHILTNIVKNAIESMEDRELEEKTLTIAVFRQSEDVFIRISDTGPGIAEGKLESIFAFGFTTKKNGHGFGLHSCANYMTEMKGRIWAEKPESGRGASFVLQFKAPA